MQIILVLVFCASWIMTGLVRHYSLRKAILDIPNARSSHSLPTPRGGGIAIAITFFLAVGYLGWVGFISTMLVKALLGGGLIIAITGYWDDVKSLTAVTRICLQFLAAAWSLYCIGGMPILDLGFSQIHLGWVGYLIAMIGIVWLTNLYNFMDGIDGIAGSEAVFVSGVGGAILFFLGAENLATCCFVVCAATFGFLIWNWPPAKIFMGDVGSSLLGFIFALLAITSANQFKFSIFIWLALLAVFIFDATFTLIDRVRRGERWYNAHCEHAYQRLVQGGFRHRQVTLGIVLINLGFILPVGILMLLWQKFALGFFLIIGMVFLLIWRHVQQTKSIGFKFGHVLTK